MFNGLIRLMGCGLLVPASSVLRKLVEMEEFPPVSAGLLSLPTCHIQLQKIIVLACSDKLIKNKIASWIIATTSLNK